MSYACGCAGSREGGLEQTLNPQEKGASPRQEMPGNPGRRGCGRLGTWYTRHRVCVLLAVLLVVVMAVVLAVVLSGRCDCSVAPELGCPEEWVQYRRVCYYLSEGEGSWEWSQEQCFSRGASLAVLQRDWEMEFAWRLRGNFDYWLGLRRRGELLEWVDGSSFNHTVQVVGEDDCLFLADLKLMSSRCSQLRPYLCSKPMLL